MTRKTILLATALSLVALPAVAARDTSMYTIKGLMASCDTPQGTERHGKCLGFITGVLAMEQLDQGALASEFCPPDSETKLVNGLVIMMDLLHEEAHSSRLSIQNMPARDVVVAASKSVFPCSTL